MILSNVIVDITIPRRSFVFGQSRAKVSAGFTNVRSLAVTAFDLVYCSLSVFRRTDREQYTRSNAFSVEQLILTEDGYRTGYRNASHCQQQQCYSGLPSPRRSNSSYFRYFLSLISS